MTGLKIEIDQYVDYFVVDHREHPGRKAFDDYVTDGGLVYLRQRSADGVPVKAVLHRGSELKQGDVPLILRTDGRATCAPTV